MSPIDNSNTPPIKKRRAKHYAPRPLKVNKDFRDFIISIYPGLLRKEFYIRLMQHITHGPRDKETRRLLITEDMVRAMAKCYHKGTTVERLLQEFQKDAGIDLRLSCWNFEEGEARSMDPMLDSRVYAALEQEKMFYRKRGDNKGLVWYDTGKPVSDANERKTLKDYDEELMEISAQISDRHPGRDLMDWLHTQTHAQVEEQLKNTADLVWQEIKVIPGKHWYTGGVYHFDKDQERKEYARNHFLAMMQFPAVRYKSVNNTWRLFAQGCGLAKLPSRLRNLALAGCWQIDLRAAQLGIVAKTWQCPRVREFLENKGDIWEEMYRWLGVGPEAKGKIKQALYSVVFGSSKGTRDQSTDYGAAGIRARWTQDELWDDAISADLCEKFLSHPLVDELYKAAKVQMKMISNAGGAYDAFGLWWDVHECTKISDGEKRRSILAAVVQSHELKIMLEMLPVLKSLDRCYPMVFLHDGLVIRLSGRTLDQEREAVFSVTAAINRFCRNQGYLTSGKPERLPHPDDPVKEELDFDLLLSDLD